MLTAAIADAYFGWQLDMTHIGFSNESMALEQKIRSIADARVQHGLDPYDILHQADAEIAAMREDIATYHVGRADAPRRDRGVDRHFAFGCAGISRAPAARVRRRRCRRASGLDLVARRSEVQASRWRVEAAVREIDIARAAFYPDVSISAMVGLSSIDLGKLFQAGSRVFDAGPALHLPIFEGGRLQARYGASQAALDAAIADYNKAVIDAAHDAANQALTLAQIQARRTERAGQIAAAERLYQSSLSRGKRGLTDARAEYNASIELIRQHDADTQLVAAGISAEIALTKALGGGYVRRRQRQQLEISRSRATMSTPEPDARNANAKAAQRQAPNRARRDRAGVRRHRNRVGTCCTCSCSRCAKRRTMRTSTAIRFRFRRRCRAR